MDDADKLHHLSEALGFIYSLSFNSEGRVTSDEAYAALIELGWPANNKTLTGIYEINLYDVTDEKLKAAKTSLDASLPGFANVKF